MSNAIEVVIQFSVEEARKLGEQLDAAVAAEFEAAKRDLMELLKSQLEGN